MVAVALLLITLAQTPEELVRQLGHEESTRRDEAAQALETLGERALPALEQGAKSDDPEVRERAADVLYALRMTLAVGVKLDPDRLARVKEAIGDWRERAKDRGGVSTIDAPDPTAYDDLLEYPGGQQKAADLEDIPYLLGILWDPGRAEGEAGGLPRAQYLRWRAVQALRHFPMADENEKRIIAILHKVLPGGDCPETRTEERYWGCLFSEVALISQSAIRESLRGRILAALSLLAKSSQPTTRARVAEALSAWEDDELVPVLATLIEDPDPEVQMRAVTCLDQRDPVPFRQALERIVQTSESEWIRYLAAKALARCGEKAGIDALFELAASCEGGLWIKAFRSIQDLVAEPESLAHREERVLEAWNAWWAENRKAARWDPDRQLFVTE